MRDISLSIVTPSLDREEYIGQAIESVIAQHWPMTQHVVVDGGSTDGTLEVVRKYRGVIVVEGHDRGMYDALNKGLAISWGDIIGFLNSDDMYADGAFGEVLEGFLDPDVQAVVGRAKVFEVVEGGTSMVVETFDPEADSLLNLVTLGSPFFNAWFFRRRVFELLGGFDPAYKVAGDREFMLRFALGQPVIRTVDRAVYLYRRHPDTMTFSLTSEKLERIAREHLRMNGETLAKSGVSGEVRSLIRMASTRDTIRLFLRSAREGALRKALFFAISGMRVDPLWIPRLAHWIMIRLRREAIGHGQLRAERRRQMP